MISIQSQTKKDIFRSFNFLLQKGCISFDVEKVDKISLKGHDILFSTSNLVHPPFKICWLESYGHLAYIIWGGGGNWKMDLVLGGKGIIEEKGVVKREGEMIVLSQFFLSWDKKTHKA